MTDAKIGGVNVVLGDRPSGIGLENRVLGVVNVVLGGVRLENKAFKLRLGNSYPSVDSKWGI